MPPMTPMPYGSNRKKLTRTEWATDGMGIGIIGVIGRAATPPGCITPPPARGTSPREHSCGRKKAA
jgi:hypothetical protein